MKLTKAFLINTLKSNNEYLSCMSQWKRDKLIDTVVKLNLIIIDSDPEPPFADCESFWIPLRNAEQKIVDWALIDKTDFNEVSMYKWHLVFINNKKYAANNYRIHMHVLLNGKAPKNMVIDHIDNNGLNNKKSNLRIVTRANNSQNRRKKQGTSSQYIGVTMTKWGWCAKSGKVNIGYFKEETHAAYAYDEFIIEKFSGNGKINKIDIPDGYIGYQKKIKGDLPKGVAKRGSKFRTQYWDAINKTYIHLGTFNSVETASQKYQEYKNEAEIKLKQNYQKTPILRNNKNIAIVPVFQSGSKIDVLVDDDLWHYFMLRKWYIDDNGYPAALRTRMHSEVLPAVPDMIIDHIYSKLDNRRSSLRYNTAGGNNHHRAPTNTIGIKGVSKVNNKYSATITFEKKRYYLGRYPTSQIAGFAYDQAALQLYKKVASINGLKNPQGWEWNSNTFRLVSYCNAN